MSVFSSDCILTRSIRDLKEDQTLNIVCNKQEPSIDVHLTLNMWASLELGLLNSERDIYLNVDLSDNITFPASKSHHTEPPILDLINGITSVKAQEYLKTARLLQLEVFFRDFCLCAYPKHLQKFAENSERCVKKESSEFSMHSHRKRVREAHPTAESLSDDESGFFEGL